MHNEGGYNRLTLDTILDQPTPWGTKGVHPGAFGRPLRDIGTLGWNLLDGDVPLPACVVKQSALAHNRATMARYADTLGLDFAPHGKTTMAPQLFRDQISDGAWGMTAATPAHLMVYRSLGISRIIYANQLVDPIGIGFLLDELARDPAFECLCLVDSVAGARLLHEALAARPGQPSLDVLIEIGLSGGRCGVRTTDQALALAAALQEMQPHFRIRGVEAFEGIAAIDPAGAEQVRSLLAIMKETMTALLEANMIGGEPVVSVGGSAFIQLVASEMATWPFPARRILRSGCYITNDHGLYANAQHAAYTQGGCPIPAPFRPALEIWGHVQSRPDAELAVLSIGKRDISHDIEMPIPVLWAARGNRQPQSLGDGFQVIGLNDQHARVTVPAEHPLAVGDRVMLGCSHPCTTFDKWRTILVVDDDYAVLDALATCF